MSERYWIINGQAVSDYHDLGYTEYSSSPCRIWNSGGSLVVNAWRASGNEPDIPLYYWIGDDGSGQPVNRWFEDEAALEKEGYSITPPLTGYIYGLMGEYSDSEKHTAESGDTGYQKVTNKSNLFNSGIPSYGEMRDSSTIEISIGIDTIVPQNVDSIKTNYYWFYHFNGGSSYSNLWTPMYVADNTNPVNPPSEYETIPNSNYENVWLWNGSALTSMNGLSGTFKLAVYSNKPEFWTNLNTSADKVKSYCVIEPASTSTVWDRTMFNIPDDLYTINGTTITWNTSHLLYDILYGKSATVTYY